MLNTEQSRLYNILLNEQIIDKLILLTMKTNENNFYSDKYLKEYEEYGNLIKCLNTEGKKLWRTHVLNTIQAFKK